MKLHVIKDEYELRALMGKLREMEHFAYDTETTGFDWWKTEVFLLSFSDGETAWLVYVRDFTIYLLKFFLFCVFENPKKSVVGHNLKFDRHHTKATFGVEIRRQCHDTLIKAHLLDENRQNGLKPLMKSIMSMDNNYEEAVHAWLKANLGAQENWDFSQVPRDFMSPYAGMDSYATFLLDKVLSPHIESHFATTYELDRRVADILYRMEQNGVKIDLPYLQRLQVDYQTRLEVLLEQVFLKTGYTFNPDSDVELAEVLYGKLKLPCNKFTPKGGSSVDAEALQGLEHPSIQTLLEYSEKRHMLSNFILPLQQKADSRGYIHSDYSLTTTKTGRFACRSPNMQNMPKDEALRRAFICDEGKEMWFWDHSQIEMVGFTMYSKDPKMTEALKNAEDLHRLAAMEALEKKPEEIDKELRAMGKGTNFAIIFGVGKAKLARYINGYISDRTRHLTNEQALLFKQKYFYKFPSVQSFQRQVMDTVRTRREPWGHFVKNKFGRVRRLNPDKAYQGVNHLIQGWAAYLMKASMVRIDEKFPGTDWRQNVHDAIRIDNHINGDMVEEWAQEVGHCLTEWPDIPVPVSCTIEKSSTNWAEVKPVPFSKIAVHTEKQVGWVRA